MTIECVRDTATRLCLRVTARCRSLQQQRHDSSPRLERRAKCANYVIISILLRIICLSATLEALHVLLKRALCRASELLRF